MYFCADTQRVKTRVNKHMNYSKKYLNFINGRYAGEGMRITIGIVLPSFLMSYFNQLNVGLVISIGALCVSVADTPGASRHRFNGMFACLVLVSAVSIVAHLASANRFVLGALIIASGFFFSMLTVFGNRGSAVGVAALLVLVLSLQTPLHSTKVWINAGYIFAGGAWYMLYSLVLYRIRPYRFIQQVLADYIHDVSQYLKLRGHLYASTPDYEKINEQLLQRQLSIEAEQHLLSDLLFNTRTIVKESTHTGRVLVKTYLEVTELYEAVMTTYQQCSLLHEHFDNTGILQEYQRVIYMLANEMEEVSMAFQSGITSEAGSQVKDLIAQTRFHFEDLRQHFMDDDNVENFVSLGRIQHNLEDLADQIAQLHLYTNYEVKLGKDDKAPRALINAKPSNDIRFTLFWSNLNFRSNIFRHSIRVALALLVGFIVSLFFKVDRGYWILLTIVVILKPAYALSKKRNAGRLIGTVLGIVVGFLILYFITISTVLLVLMLIFMAGSYMFMRTNYFVTVVLMTTYLLIFFHYIHPGNLQDLMVERLVDTAIGSVIAFFASLFIIPAWERSSIRSYMLKLLDANEKYYECVASNFAGDASLAADAISLCRRQSLVAMANLSDAFNRMMSEPKRYRQGLKNIHRFITLNHGIITHLSSLNYLLQTEQNRFRSALVKEIVANTKRYFQNAKGVLLHSGEVPVKPDSTALKQLNGQVDALLQARKAEINSGALETQTKKELVEAKSVSDQFNFLHSNAASIYKLAREHDAEMAKIAAT